MRVHHGAKRHKVSAQTRPWSTQAPKPTAQHHQKQHSPTCQRNPALLSPDAVLWVLVPHQLLPSLKGVQRCLKLLKLVAGHAVVLGCCCDCVCICGVRNGGGELTRTLAEICHVVRCLSAASTRGISRAGSTLCMTEDAPAQGRHKHTQKPHALVLTPCAGVPWRWWGRALLPWTRPAPHPSTAAA